MTQNPQYQPPQQGSAFGQPTGGPGGHQLGYGGYVGPGGPKPRGIATASMVLGICSLAFCLLPYINFCISPILAVLAIIFGIVARGAVRRGEAEGEGMATAGLVMGIIALSLEVLVIVLVLVGFGLAGIGAGMSGS